MKFVVIGAGATGGYFGGQLAKANKDVTFVARGDHYTALKARGLEIYSAQERITFPVSVVETPDQVGRCDVVLLAVKCYDLERAITQIEPIVGPDTRVLCIQNGVDAPEMAARRFGPERILGGLTRIEAVLLAPGVVGHFSTFAKFAFGAWERENGPFEQQLFAELRHAGVDCELSPDVRKALWEKMLGLCPVAASTSLTRSTLGEILSCPESRAMHVAAIEEIALVARAVGVDLGADATERALRWHETLAPSVRASMARDLEAGRRVELDQLSGTVARMGRELGVPTPMHAMIYAALKPLALAAQERHRASGEPRLYFGEYLVRAGRITNEQLTSILRLLKLEEGRGAPLRVGDALVQLGLVARETVEGLKEQYDVLLAERGRNTVW
ncbi:MAG: 2-dehydropantoate 2-reductase [Deltaproteobacteria bacterium]|nr:2-dehydropantoate 2-reductase [Deltaproteobacteria bacterium]